MSIKPQELIEDSLKLFSLPQIYFMINEAVNHPQISFDDIAQIIRQDPGLSARLLKIVNSGFYSFPDKIETITHAVCIVGTNQLRDLALATCILKTFEGIPAELIDMDSFWRHSVACGLASHTIAVYRHEENPERFIIAGMLHDIGKLILYTRLQDQAAKILATCRSKKESSAHAEKTLLGFDHSELGGMLLEAWNFPLSQIEAVKYHHNPLESSEFSTDAAIIHIGDIITHSLRVVTKRNYIPPLNPRAWDLIDLPASLLPSILSQVETQFIGSIKFFLEN